MSDQPAYANELVLRWLDEAHAFGDLESYARSLFAGPMLEGPLDRLARQAERGARMGGIGTRPEVVNKAVRTALRETFFRFELVMRINVVAHDLLDREVLIDAALAANLGVLSALSPKAREADTTYLARFAELRDLLGLGSGRFTPNRRRGRWSRSATSPGIPRSSRMP